MALVPVVAIAAMSEQMTLLQRPVAGTVHGGAACHGVSLTQLILAHVPIFGVRLFRPILGPHGRCSTGADGAGCLGLVHGIRLVARFAITPTY